MATHSSILASIFSNQSFIFSRYTMAYIFLVGVLHLSFSFSHSYFYFVFQLLKYLDCDIYVSCCCLVVKSCPTLLWPHGLQPTSLPCPWDFPGKNGVGCHALLQGIFPTQGSNLYLLCLLLWQETSSPVAPPGEP